MTPFILVAVLADLAAGPHAQAPLPAAERIQIAVTQGGWGFEQATLDVRREARGYTDGKRVLDASLVDAVVAAATAPAIPLDVGRIRVDANALRREGEIVAKQLPPQTARRFIERLGDPANLPHLVHAMVASRWSDDEPSVNVTITLHGGKNIEVSTQSQSPLMLPWHVVHGDRGEHSYDPALSRAVAALLPAGFLNRERLAGDHLAAELAHVASMQWRSDLESRGAEEIYGPQLAPLERRFHILRQLVGFISSFDSDGEKVWNGRLMPIGGGQLEFDLTLTAGSTIASVEPFLHDVDDLTRRVRALSWVSAYLKTHPLAKAVVQYRDDRSLGAGAQKRILRDLRRQPALAARVEPLLDRSIGLYVENQNRFAIWIVLPDGSALPHFAPDPGPDDLVRPPEGTLVGPDGKSHL